MGLWMQSSTAQTRRCYFNIDWQIAIPMSNDFADRTSGWGMNFEGGYFLTPTFAMGPFMMFHTNFQSVDRQTIPLDGGAALTTNQEHAIFELPFGVAMRKIWGAKNRLRPYIALKMGTAYTQVSSYYYLIKEYDNGWGFYFSPEMGATIYPKKEGRLGIHMAMYYGYATNEGQVLTYTVKGIHHLGFRLGLAF